MARIRSAVLCFLLLKVRWSLLNTEDKPALQLTLIIYPNKRQTGKKNIRHAPTSHLKLQTADIHRLPLRVVAWRVNLTE